MITFNKLIFKLCKYWSNLGGCFIQPLDIEVGAATFHPITFFNCFNKKKLFYFYIQLCRRPNDSRCGNSYNRLQQYYQFQVITKPSLKNIQYLYINSLKYLNIDLNLYELRFIEDNWENPTLGAYGVGWEVWLNGMEITQFTYFQKMGGFDCIPILCEITYGLERISLYLQNVNHINKLIWDYNNIFGKIKYIDILNNEIDKYNYIFENSNVEFLFLCMNNYKYESLRLINLDKPLIKISYEFAIKMVYYFNLLDAKNYFSKIERQNNILYIRKIFNKIASLYLNL